MRGILLVVFASVITVVAAFFLFHREEFSEIGEQKANIGGLPNDLLPHPPQAPPLLRKERGEGGRGSDDSPSLYLEVADKYIEEALLLVELKDRFVLIDKINAFKGAYEIAVAKTYDLPTGQSGLEPLIRATARYISVWSPFYYYLHADAKGVLGPIIKMLERKRAEMLNELVKHDARKAGRLATEDIEYYIEDIRKSAARRNSDFIIFSLKDYEEYRKVFDELAQAHPEFLFGFVENADILLDDFYRMHEEVDPDYLEKIREKVEDVRLGLRDLHKRALKEFAKFDSSAAQKAREKTISAVEHELSVHFPPAGGWRSEIHDIIKSDYEFYKNIRL